MKIHEYQAKNILSRYGVAVPRGEMAETMEEAAQAARNLFAVGAAGVVVKAQIHAGGRGKGGGVKIARSVEEAAAVARKMLGMRLVTHQTGAEGRIVRRLLLEETLPIEKEYYLGIVLDRQAGKFVFMASAAGGMEIEKVAAETPEAIVKEHLEPGLGLLPYQARKLAFALGLKPAQIRPATQFMMALERAAEESDASLVEINPLISTPEGRLYALDAKINFDDNALYRHTDLKELRDITEEDPLEVEAGKYSLNYVKLDGNVGCMVNGAGLAMATMDIIQHAGGMPANFLDVGGGANEDQVTHALEILLSRKERQVCADQHFRRHSAGAIRWPTAWWPPPARPNIQVAHRLAPGRNQRRGGPGDSEGIWLELHRRRTMKDGGGKGRGLRPGAKMSILVDRKSTRVLVQD